MYIFIGLGRKDHDKQGVQWYLFMNKQVAINTFGLLVVLYVLVVIAQYALLGNLGVIRLGSAPPLTGQVSQSLGVNPDHSMPLAGKDYTFTPHYFNGKTWIVGSVVPLNNSLNASVIIMQMQGGHYRVALGPVGAVTYNQLQALPGNVAGYLTTKVSIYEILPSQ
jgi:hypothetical protein